MAKSRKVCRTTFPHPRIIIFNFFFPLIFFFVSFYLPQLEAVTTGINTNTIGCASEKNPLQIIVLFDISQEDFNYFKNQQKRIEKVLRHINLNTKERSKFYGLIAFHRSAVVLNTFNSLESSNIDKFIEQIRSLRPRRHLETSPAKALITATQLFPENSNNSKNIIFLVHNGENTDMVNESIEAITKLSAKNISVFAIAGESFNERTLLSYTKEEKFLTGPKSENLFLSTLDKEINVCSDLFNSTKIENKLGELNFNKNELNQKSVENIYSDFECKNGSEIDLIILLDTSGSIFPSFNLQHQLAQNILKEINNEEIGEKLRIGLISFSSEPNLVLTLKESLDNKEVIERLKGIEFTGRNTRIADAVELALSEFEMGGRRNSKKILILISDGHGQEFWSRAQAVGRRLQQTPSLISFAVSASQDFNFPELMLYIGNQKRIFVGKSHKEFVSTFSSILNNCLDSKKEKNKEDNEEKDILTNGSKNKFKEIFTNLSKIEQQPNNNLKNFSLGNDLQIRQKDEPLEKENKDNLMDGNNEKIFNFGERLIMPNNVGSQKTILSTTPSLPNDCPTDLLFVIDSFNAADGISSPFEKQLALAVQLVGRLPSTDVDLGRIRLAALSFGREPRLEARWSEHLGKLDFQRRLRSIRPTKVQSSFASAVNLTLQEINIQRRQSARLLMFVLWSGSNGRNTAEELSKAVRPFNSLQKSELFAVAVTPSAQLTRLKSLVGDQWHVFIDARAKQFVEQVAKILLECVLPPSGRHESKGELLDSHEPINSVERVEHLQIAAKALQRESPLDCENDPIDLIILLNADPKQTLPEQFDALKRAAKDTIRQAPPEQFQNRIRVSIWSGTPLQKQEPLTLDDALFAIDRIDWPNEETSISLTEALGIALAETFKSGRGEEARSALVLLTDGYSSEKNGNNKKLQKSLESQTIAIFGLNFGNSKFNENIQNQISSNTFSSKPSFLRLFNARGQGQMAKFVDEFQRRIIRCRGEMKIRRADSVLINNNFGGIKRQRDLRFRNENDGKIVRSSQIQRDSPQPLNNNGECKADLMFVIDTSQSVEEEFREQLDLVLELISRLPDKNFENRNIQIGTVSFHRNALLHFTIGEIKEKHKIFEAISNIQHTGGSTSAVSGINLALEQIEKRRRFDAKQIIVLVSDGNSQDPWGDVVATSGRLKASGVELFAVTVSHDHFFRELELLAGNEMKVYINSRTKQFFEEIEKVLICNKNIETFSNFPSETLINKNQNLTKLEAISDFPFKRLINTNTIVQSEQKQSEHLFFSSFSTVSPSLIISPIVTTTNISPSTLFPTLFETSRTTASANDCNIQNVDILFILDTSTSVEKDFVAQKNFALDLINILPEQDFNKRLSISLIIFNKKASIQFPFLIGRQQNDILKEIKSVEHTGGPTSLVAASETALEEISKNHRFNSRLIIILITDGHSQDEWSKVQIASQKLRNATEELYAISFSDNFAQNELLEYIKNPKRIYTDRGSDEKFLRDLSQSIVGCPGREEILTEVNTDNNLIKPAKALGGIVQKTRILELNEEERDDRFERDEEIKSVQTSEINENNEKNILPNCSFSKMDLIIILDASSSRESVFEHQRELALSLIERLPISVDDTHVAIGINSFTNVPVLRQTLGLGRNREMVRKAIEDISYRGGSTLTSKAVELAVQDLEKGRRPDALQVIVLMNDGMSQDPWDNVLAASKKLAQSGAERFGVALGEEVDLRELEHYVGDKKRIYRDGSTERFLQDIVGLINNKSCFDNSEKKSENLDKNDKENNEGGDGGPREFGDFQRDDSTCQKAKLDLIVVLDNTDSTGNDPKLSSNRYLLLDVLGSLPLSHRVRLAVISIGEQRQELSFSEAQDRESVFKRIERINSISVRPNYSKAVETAINYYNGAGRKPEGNGLILIVGDGKNDLEGAEERKRVGGVIKKTPGLSCHAVDSSKEVDEQTLSAFTGSTERIYPYDRNAEFAHFLLSKALECQPSEALNSSSNFFSAGSEEQIEKTKEDEEMEEEPFERREIKNNSSKQILIEEKRIIDEIEEETEENKNQRQKDIIAIPLKKEEEEETFNLNLENKIILPNKQKLNENNLKNNEKIVLSRINTTKSILTTSTVPPTLINLSTTKSPTINSLRTTNKQNVFNINGNNFRNNLRGIELRKHFVENITIPPTTTRKPTTSKQTSTTTKKQQIILETITNKQIISSQRIHPPLQFTTSSSLSTQSTTTSTFSTPTTKFKPGCLIDLILLIDSSGSVEQAFEQEKRLAADIIRKLRLGPQNAHVALIKFAAADKVRTIQSFLAPQSQERLLYLLKNIPFSDGITAIHSALQQAISEYTIERGARPGVATPIAVVITDGFGQHDFSIESLELHKLIPNIFAVAVNNNETMPFARDELARISGDPNRVFTDKSISELHKQLDEKLRGC